MVMNIQDFVEKTKKDWDTTYRARGAAEVLLGKMKDIQWADTFHYAGYHSVRVNTRGWHNIHSWCIENFGEQHYTWTGNVFWFDNEQNAIMFALKWS